MKLFKEFSITKENKSRLERIETIMKYLEKRGTNKEWLNTEYHKEIKNNLK